MKKKFLAVLFAAVSAIAVLAFAGCKENEVKKVKLNDQNSLVFVASSEVMEITDDTSLYDYINALKDKGELTFEGNDSEYGFFITSMDGTANVEISNAPYEGYSWMIYIDFTALEGDSAVYAGAYSDTVYEYENLTLYSADYGLSGIPCVEGHTYAFVYEYYNFG